MTGDISFQEALADVQTHVVHLADQMAAYWRDAEPMLREWVAAADQLTEAQWMDEAESSRAFYDKLKALLAKIDAERLNPSA